MSYDVFTDDSIDGYIDLYNQGTSIKDINPLSNENYKIFMLANTDIRILDRDEVTSKLVRLEKIKYFLNDHVVYDRFLGKDVDVKGNKYFYMIPVQTIKGTIVDFIFRRVFDKKSNKFDYKQNRYHSINPSRKDYIKKLPIMYGFYKDFENFEKDSIKGAMPIVICEGVKDCIYLKQFYPYVLSMNTSTIGFNAYVLRNLTDKLIFVSDTDQTGTEQFYKDRYSLKDPNRLGFSVSKVSLDKDIKDPAEYIKYPEREQELKNSLLREINVMMFK